MDAVCFFASRLPDTSEWNTMMPAITREERTGRERYVVARWGNALYERFVAEQLKRRMLDMLRGQTWLRRLTAYSTATEEGMMSQTR